MRTLRTNGTSARRATHGMPHVLSAPRALHSQCVSDPQTDRQHGPIATRLPWSQGRASGVAVASVRTPSTRRRDRKKALVSMVRLSGRASGYLAGFLPDPAPRCAP
eukprot:5159879-Prymnesium_polylepis.2